MEWVHFYGHACWNVYFHSVNLNVAISTLVHQQQTVAMDDTSTCSEQATVGNLIMFPSSPLDPYHHETGCVSKFVSDSTDFVLVNWQWRGQQW